MQGLQGIGVGGEIVKDVGECHASGFIAAEDENERLGKYLIFSQTFKKTEPKKTSDTITPKT